MRHCHRACFHLFAYNHTKTIGFVADGRNGYAVKAFSFCQKGTLVSPKTRTVFGRLSKRGWLCRHQAFLGFQLLCHGMVISPLAEMLTGSHT